MLADNGTVHEEVLRLFTEIFDGRYRIPLVEAEPPPSDSASVWPFDRPPYIHPPCECDAGLVCCNCGFCAKPGSACPAVMCP